MALLVRRGQLLRGRRAPPPRDDEATACASAAADAAATQLVLTQVELADFLADFLGAKPQPRPMLACLSDPYMQTPCPILSYYRVLSTEVLSYYRVCTV